MISSSPNWFNNLQQCKPWIVSHKSSSYDEPNLLSASVVSHIQRSPLLIAIYHRGCSISCNPPFANIGTTFQPRANRVGTSTNFVASQSFISFFSNKKWRYNVSIFLASVRSQLYRFVQFNYDAAAFSTCNFHQFCSCWSDQHFLPLFAVDALDGRTCCCIENAYYYYYLLHISCWCRLGLCFAIIVGISIEERYIWRR